MMMMKTRRRGIRVIFSLFINTNEMLESTLKHETLNHLIMAC